MKRIIFSLILLCATRSGFGQQLLSGQGSYVSVGTGTVTSAQVSGTPNQITVSGTCTIITSGNCTVSLATSLILPSGTVATTAAFGDLSNLVANTAFVQAAVSAIQLTKYNAVAYGAAFNTQYTGVGDASSGSPTVTCSTCTFVSGDIGKEGWMLGTTSAGSSQLVCPQSTISAVNSGTSVTLSNNCTANLVTPATGLFVWGTNDDTALNNAWTAASNACQALYLPEGNAIVSTAKFNAYSGCLAAGNYQQPGVHGVGKSGTLLLPDPNFSFTGCTPACFMGGQYSIVEHFSVWGGGYSPAGGANKVLVENNSGFFTDMDFTGWCKSCTGSTGVKFVGPGAQAQFGGSEGFGETSLSMNAATAGAQGLINFIGVGSRYGLHVVAGTTQSLNNTFGGCFDTVIVDSGATLDSRSDTIFPQSGTAVPCPSGNAGQGNGPILVNGRANFDHIIPSGFSPVIIGTVGVVTARNSAFPSTNATTTFPGNGLNIYNGSWLLENPGGVYVDGGGNSYAGVALNVAAPTYKQNQNARVSGSGTSSAITITVNTTGDAIFVLQSWVGSGANSSGCTDTQSNTYTHYKADTNTGSTYGTARRTSLWYTLTSTAGSDTITCTISSAATFFLVAPVEINGQSASALDGAPTTLTGSGTFVGGGAVGTTGANNDLILELIAQDTTATYGLDTSNNGITQTAPAVSGTGTYTLAYGPVTPSGVAYSLQGSLSVNTDWVAYIVQIPTLASSSAAGAIAGTDSVNAAASVSSNYVLSGGWGSTATVTLGNNPRAGRARYTITASGTGQGASPTVTFTYPKAFVVAPQCSISQDGGTQSVVAGPWNVSTPTTTSVVFTYTGTPGASNTLTGIVGCS